MTADANEASGTDMEQIKIILNSLYLCLGYAMKHIAIQEGIDSAARFKSEMLTALKGGKIDAALLEESKTFEFVVEKIEALVVPEV